MNRLGHNLMNIKEDDGKLSMLYLKQQYEVPEIEITPRVARLLALMERPRREVVRKGLGSS